MLKQLDNRVIAILCIFGGVGLASAQDAIVKSLSSDYPAYETLMFRCIGSLPVLAFFMYREGRGWSIATSFWRLVMLRGIILGVAYLAFVLSIAAMPIAQAVSIYFTMPFFVAGLAGPILGERVRPHRWLAIIAGFIGVLIILRPGAGVFEPAALLALLAAMGYAVGQMIGRPISQHVPPIIIAIWQNTIYMSLGVVLALLFNLFDFGEFHHPSLVFLSRPLVMPGFGHALLLLGQGVIAAFAMLLFVNAYKYAEANFVAPFEYSAMVWAVLYGFVLFNDFPNIYTWVGSAIVVAAGIFMVLKDRQLDRTAA